MAVATISVELPEAALAEHSIGVITYIDRDGKQRYSHRTSGDLTIAAALGLLELVKHDLYVASLGQH